MKSNLCILLIHFNDYALCKERLTRSWIRGRISIFMKYTCKSLLAQSCQEFYAFVLIHPSSSLIVDLELRSYPSLPKQIVFTSTLEPFQDILKDYDEFYLISLDSDDLYHPSLVQRLYQYQMNPDSHCVLCPNGYIYDTIAKRLGICRVDSHSYYAEHYKTSEYISGTRYHAPAILNRRFKNVIEFINEPLFIKLHHTLNSKVPHLPVHPIDWIIDENEKRKILNSFGIEE